MLEYNSSDNRELTSIRLTGFLNTLVNSFLDGYRKVILTTDGIIFRKKITKKLHFEEISEEIYLRKKFGLSFLIFTSRNGSKIQVGPINYKTALTFTTRANKEWRNHYKAFIEAKNSEISLLAKVYTSLEKPRRYPSACLLKPYINRSREFYSKLPQYIPEQLVEPGIKKNLEKIKQLVFDSTKLRERAISTFIKDELKAQSDFFDTIENHPLTREQRLSIVTDEDATLVLAGAGSGKTSVITTKAIYLIQEKIRTPEEILLITYSRKAAQELQQRIRRKINVDVNVLTFHGLGNYILREVEERPPPLAQHAQDNKKFRKLIQTILIEEVANNKSLETILRKWFEELYLPYKSEWEFKSLHEYHQYLDTINKYYKSRRELRSLKGDKVRSYEELQIANWLYLNGIEYEYEPIYEFK